MINCSLASGVVPADLKMAAVTPILKKSGLDHLNMGNYRPISNLPFLSKVLERVVASQLRSHLDINGLFEPFQSGFRPAHSTETALLRVVNDILLSMDAGLINILMLLDLSAAFDTVCHEILISRLSDIGITGSALSWLISYISDRKYYITIQGFRSATASLTQGVPQGSVLGPLLFIIYIYPLGDIIRRHGLQFHCYADDIQIYLTTSSDRLSLPDSLTECIRDIKKWMSLNFLKLNDNKTEILLIGSTASAKRIDQSFDVDGIHVKPSSLIRNLGVLFDSTLSFGSHISSLVKNYFFHLRNIARLRSSLTLADAETLIHALITSRLDYCNALLLGLPKKLIARLQYVQNSAARVLTSTRRSAHITPLLHDLHWLPVASRIHFKVLLLTFKALNGLAPQYLSDLLYPYRPARSLRSAELGLLTVPRFRLSTVGGRAFGVNAPQLWNSLPLTLRNTSSVGAFKIQLKTYLFDMHFG
uniref:Reverse transcriptase domain-containing protein n=1 Tax=Hucho hucho TaxID=62062 RepID=A0A4W5LB64_9TELE